MAFQYEFLRLVRPYRTFLLTATALTAFAGTQAAAQTVQTWTGNANNVFGNGGNWTPGPSPGATDDARLDGVTGNSNAVRTITLGAADASVRQIDVVSGAGAYTINTSGRALDIGLSATGGIAVASGSSLTISNTGGGVVAFDNASVASGNLTINSTGIGSGVDFRNGSNAGSTVMTFGLGSNATFNQNSSAGNASITAGSGTLVFFFNDSRGGNSTIVSNGSARFEFNGNANAESANITVNGAAGEFRFWQGSSAGNAAITINDGLVSFGQTATTDTATADNATIRVNGGALLFEGNTTAGNATVFVESAAFGVLFGDNATGGNARFVLAADGFGGLMDFSATAGQGGVVTAGSIEGGGEIRIGGFFNNTFRVGSNDLSTTFSGLICECFGQGALEKVGTGTLTLSGDNTYTGGTTISGGTLQIGNGGTTGSVIGNILNNSILAINRSDNFNFANSLSGSGALSHIGAGTTTLTGNNTYTGATTVMSGTLQAGGVNAFGVGSAVTVNGGATLSLNNFNQTVGSLAGAGNVTLGNATLTAGDATSTIFSGVMSGTGGLITAGAGTLVLAGNNTYAGGTTISGGTLQIGNGGTTGAVIGNILNNSTLAINRSDSFNFVNNISGTGVLNHIGTGTATLTGTNTYTGATNVMAGTLQAGGVNAFGVGSAVTVNGGATLSLNNFNQTVGSLSGAGNVSLGTATLTAGGAGGTFSGVIGGTGGFTKTGAGAFTLTGNNTYTGLTTIAGGTLHLGNGGTSGAIVGDVLNNGILAVNRSNTVTLAGVISGTGAFQQNGTGTTILTGNSSYTGATAVNAGTLIVNGSIASSSGLTVNGGAIGGNGILPSATINGTLAPGNSIGTIVVQGNLTMGANSTYAVEFNGSSADRVNVSGTAALAGTVALQPLGQVRPSSYTILSAGGGLSGAFAGLDRSLVPSTFVTSLSYTNTDVLVNVSAAMAQLSGLNRNQRAVATGIDTGANRGGDFNAGFVTLYNLPGAALPSALTQLSGEVASGASTAGLQLMNQYLGLLLNPFAEGRGGAFGPALADAYAAAMPVKAAPPATSAQRWSVWGAAYGGANRTRGEGAVIGSHDINPRGYGFAAGADYRAGPGTLLGFSLAGGGTSWSLSGGLGSGRTDVFQTGGYASHQFGAAYISGALAYAWHDGTVDRTLTVAGTDMLRGNFDANSLGARIEGGYRVAIRSAGLTPYAALQGQSFRTSGFGETARAGSAQFALDYRGQTSTAARAELGVWADSRIDLAHGSVLALRGRLAWAHDDVTGARIGAAFQALPGSSFTVLGAAAPSDLALVTAGAELRLRNKLSVGAKFDGEFAGRAQTYGGAGTIRYSW